MVVSGVHSLVTYVHNLCKRKQNCVGPIVKSLGEKIETMMQISEPN